MCKINYVSMQPNIESNDERKKLNLPNFNEYSQTIPANCMDLELQVFA